MGMDSDDARRLPTVPGEVRLMTASPVELPASARDGAGPAVQVAGRHLVLGAAVAALLVLVVVSRRAAAG